MHTEMRFDIFDHRPQPFALVITGAFIMDLAKGACKRVSFRALGGQEEQLHPGVRRQPLHHGLRFVNLIIIHHDIEVSETPRWIRVLECLEQVQKQAVGFPPPDPVLDRSRA